MVNLAQVEAADPEATATEIDGWKTIAAAMVDNAGLYVQFVTLPGGQDWSGLVHDAMVTTVGQDRTAIHNVQTVIDTMADAATGSLRGVVAHNLKLVKDEIAAARAQKFTVNPDLSVTDPIAMIANNQRKSDWEAFARNIPALAKTWFDSDQQVADQINRDKAALATAFNPAALSRGAPASVGAPRIQQVDHTTTTDPTKPGAERPGVPRTVDELLSGGIDLGGPADPASTGTPPLGPKPASDGLANTPGGAALDRALRGPGNQNEPKTVEDMVLPSDRPPAKTGQQQFDQALQKLGLPGLPGRLDDPAAVAQMRAQLTQLMHAQQAGTAGSHPLPGLQLTPERIEQLIHDAVTNAKSPVSAFPTPTPGDGPGPAPGFKEGFHDRWFATEDFLHRLLGQDGASHALDAWKDLGVGIGETFNLYESIPNAIDNITHAPSAAYLAGGAAADATMAAPGLVMGPAGLAARLGLPAAELQATTAAEDLLSAGTHRHIGTPASTHPTPDAPAAPHHTADTPLTPHHSTSVPGTPHHAPASGPGEWTNVNESMSPRSADYQVQRTGHPITEAYVVNGVKFDDFSNGALVDAKGYYAQFTKNGQFQDWWTGQQGMIDQARRQLAAAGDTPIQWHVAEPAGVSAIIQLFEDNGIVGINVVYAPPVK
ncbi:MAG: hypothetical protein H6523_13285 [Mycolicibacterium sp.]|nr:hypothetical protein [Mycolicibacterium sp.]